MVSPDALTIGDRFEVNTVVWLRSLAEGELGPSRRMTEDLEALATAGTFAFEEVAVADRDELLAALDSIARRSESGLRPILQFDCHGSAEEGLLLEPSGERLTWSELVEALRPINVGTANSLCCIFGVCFGLHLSLGLSLSLPSPYFLTIAPEGEILVGELLDRLAPFYARLFETGNITRSYREHLAPALSIFQCTELLAKALATYIVKHASGAGGAARRERLVSRMLEERGTGDGELTQLASARQRAKSGLRLTQEHLDRYARLFLIGRKPSFGIAEVERIAEGMKRSRERTRRREERSAKARRRGRLGP